MNSAEENKRVISREDFVARVKALRKDLAENPASWENADLGRYLEALAAWVGDMDGYYLRKGRALPVPMDWGVAADMLAAAKVYEQAQRYPVLAAETDAAPIWSATKDLSAEENAAAHAAKHAGEFPELAPGDYTSAAQKFVSDPPAGALTKVRPNGDTLIYDPATNTFAVRAANGAPRTMFRPTDGANYWSRQ